MGVFFLMSEPDEHMSIAHDCLSETQALLDADISRDQSVEPTMRRSEQRVRRLLV